MVWSSFWNYYLNGKHLISLIGAFVSKTSVFIGVFNILSIIIKNI
nr:MAG TPA: hypothetical protein [Caudoviricetes sp.]DAU34414.1 MAG TPA: hypothetical protein [Caudoviricetes sp.]